MLSMCCISSKVSYSCRVQGRGIPLRGLRIVLRQFILTDVVNFWPKYWFITWVNPGGEYSLLARATTPGLDLVTRFRSACSGGKSFSIFCLIFIRWSQLFPLYCSCRGFYWNSETTVQWEHQRSTTTLKIMAEQESLHGLFLTGVVVVKLCQGQFLMR